MKACEPLPIAIYMATKVIDTAAAGNEKLIIRKAETPIAIMFAEAENSSRS